MDSESVQWLSAIPFSYKWPFGIRTQHTPYNLMHYQCTVSRHFGLHARTHARQFVDDINELSYYFVPTWLRPSDYSLICIVICVGVTCFGEHKNVERILLLYSLAHSQYILWLILYGFRISFFRSVLLTWHFLLLQIPLSFYGNMPLKVGDALYHVSWCSNFLGKKIGPLRDNEFQATAT